MRKPQDTDMKTKVEPFVIAVEQIRLLVFF